MEAIHLLAEAMVTPECADGGLGWVGGANKFARGSDDVIAFPDHGDDGAARNPTHQGFKE